MDNIIKFPTKMVRDNALIEKCLKDILDQTPANDAVKNEITKRALKVWNKYQCSFQPISFAIPGHISGEDKSLISESIKEGVQSFSKELHDHMNVIILDRIQTEIKLYLLENPI